MSLVLARCTVSISEEGNSCVFCESLTRVDLDTKCPYVQCSLHVPLHVESQMIGAGEGTLTEVTLKRSVSGVFPEVTGQLV